MSLDEGRRVDTFLFSSQDEGSAGGRPDKAKYDAGESLEFMGWWIGGMGADLLPPSRSEQDALRSQIDALQAKLVRSLSSLLPSALNPDANAPPQNDLKNKISASSNRGGPDHERKVAIRKELDALRGEQARMKGGRGKTLDQLKNMQDAMNKKVRRGESAALPLHG